MRDRSGTGAPGERDERTVRWIISGRVQGVGFRWFAKRRADRLGIHGRATNLPDGRVEILARGTSESLEAFEAVVRAGPTLAHVESVEKSDIPHDVVSSKSFETY